MLDWRGAGFTKLQDFWDRDLLRTGGAAALNADLGGGTSTLGLAEFSSGNFIGQRAIYGELIKTNDQHYFAFPSLANTTQPNLKIGHLWSTASHGDVTLANLQTGTRLYISKTGAGVSVTDHSVLSYLIAQHPGKSSGLPIVTIADDNVLSNYLAILIPKAVAYSAGILDYYFRGTLGITLTNASTGLIGLQITNTSSQDFNGGAFHLFYDDTNGFRTELTGTNFVDDYSGTLATNGTVNTTFAPNTNATQYTLVYQGTIGTASGTPLDPVDTNIAIAVKTFPTPNPLNWNNLVWDPPTLFVTASSTAADNHGNDSAADATDFGVSAANQTGMFSYTGPMTSCNLRVTVALSNSSDDSMSWGVTVSQDGVTVGQYQNTDAGGTGPGTSGTFDVPFTIAAGVNSVVQATFGCDASSNGSPEGGCAVNMSFTLTPAY